MCWGRARLSGGKGGVEGRTSLNTTAAALKVRPSWPFLFFGLGLYATSRATKALPCSALSATDSNPGKFPNYQLRELHPVRGQIQRFTVAPAWCPHLVGLHEAHKHREEDGGWSRLGAFSKVAHHTVKGFLKLGKRMFVNTVELGVTSGRASDVSVVNV